MGYRFNYTVDITNGYVVISIVTISYLKLTLRWALLNKCLLLNKSDFCIIIYHFRNLIHKTS